MGMGRGGEAWPWTCSACSTHTLAHLVGYAVLCKVERGPGSGQ